MERFATHAGSWYPSNTETLTKQLTTSRTLPHTTPNCRVIISPHAGYKYCARTMLPAYHSLDIKTDHSIKIFILGPSHHIYFKNKVLISGFNEVDTPLGKLSIDTDLAKEWTTQHPDLFKYMDPEVDMEEHSLEMQFSILYNTLRQRGITNIQAEVKIIPIMISHGESNMFSKLGQIIGDQLYKDPYTYMIISSDFCHWGRRFEYTGYVGSRDDLKDAMDEETEIEMLTSRSKLSHHQIPIWSSIEILDRYAMDILNLNDPDMWNKYLDITGNTICGRMALECLLYVIKYLTEQHDINCKWGWNKYSQSSQVQSVGVSSVSYSSGHVQLNVNKSK